MMVMIGGIDRRFTETVEVSNQLFTLCMYNNVILHILFITQFYLTQLTNINNDVI